MKQSRLTESQGQRLRAQVIDDDRPGPVLRDFGVLLDFLGTEGVEAGGKYNLLPLKCIPELDPCLSRPLRLELKRPQLRSHPYLQGLHLLLRASGLVRVEEAGARARLVVDPATRAQWDRLNPTERYFQLLEAWLRFGRAEMVGERASLLGDLLFPCAQAWSLIPAKGRRLDPEKARGVYMPGIGRDFYLLALMDLFGLLEVEQPHRPVTPWSPVSVGHNPFGDAVFSLILGPTLEFLSGDDRSRDGEEGTPADPHFGAWQPLFQPYFPEWRENLRFPVTELREGEFVFRVSLGPVWRLIAVPADNTLDDLVGCILRSVKFSSDHMYAFTYQDSIGARASASHPAMDEGPWADQVAIGTLPLEPGQSMQLLYDFGDSWKFTVKLIRVEPTGGKAGRLRVLESHGKAPSQYPNWDD